MSKETLNFKIGLSGTYWDKKPEYEILVNGVSRAKGVISAPSTEIEYIEFTDEVEEEQEHSLQIRLLNKSDNDVVKTDDGTGIAKDMLLNVEQIELDDIELEILKWTKSTYTPDEPKAGFPSNGHVNLGWNGTYEIKFTSPFYIWLLGSM